MKIKDFLSILVIGVLAILLLLNRCSSKVNPLQERYDELIKSKVQDSVLIDSLCNLTPVVDTVVTENIVYITKTRILPKHDTVTVVTIDTVDYLVTPYSFTTADKGIVVTDSMLIKGELISHKQDVYVTTKDTATVKTVYVPKEVVVTKVIKQKAGFSVWAGVRSDMLFNFQPVLSLNYRDFSLTAAKGINNEKDFTLQLQTKIRFK